LKNKGEVHDNFCLSVDHEQISVNISFYASINARSFGIIRLASKPITPNTEAKGQVLSLILSSKQSMETIT